MTKKNDLSIENDIKKWKKQPDFIKAQEETSTEYLLAKEIIKARLDVGLSQKEIAKIMKTSQSAISNLENATQSPSFKTLDKYASACGKKLQIKFI